MTAFGKFLKELEDDMIVYYLMDFQEEDYNEVDFDIKDILTDELNLRVDADPAEDKMKELREIFRTEITNQLLVRYKAVEEMDNKEATLINPRVFNCLVIDKGRMNDILKQPELLLT